MLRFRLRHRRPALVAVVMAAFLLVFGNLSSASGFTATGVTTSIKDSKCSSQVSPIKWWGAYPYISGTSPTWPSGTVVVCYTKYRLKDGDKHGDYWAIRAVSTWTLKKGYAAADAQMYQLVTSTASAKDNVYSATQTFTSSKDCGTTFSVSFGIGPFSISTSNRVCRNYTVKRFGYDLTSADWTSAKAGKLKTVETSYAQKVPEGVVPKFHVDFGIPQYINEWNGSNYVPTAHLVWQSYTTS